MKAAVLKNTKELIIEDRPLPQVKDGEILIKTAYVGICRTDRKAYHMNQQDLHMPRVLGHEITGIIEKTGGNVEGYHIGDRVQIHPGIGCGICPDCCNGNDQVCKEMEILGFHIDGGFAEYCLIPQNGVKKGIIQKVPKKLPLEIAALTEPLACAINIEERVKFKAGQKLLISGAGALGLLTATLAKIKGVTEIILLEVDPYKIEIAKDLGFQCFPHNIIENEILKIWKDGADIAVPCCPDNDAFAKSLKLLKKRGKFGFFSGLTSTNPLNRNTLNLIHYKELAVYGSYGCSLNHGKKALRMLAKQPDAFIFPTEMISLNTLESVLTNLELTDTIFKMIKFTED